MADKEEALLDERDFTRGILEELHHKAAEFKSLLKKKGPKKERTGNIELFEKAVALYHEKDYAAAAGKLEHITGIYPEFAGAYQYLALCHWNQGNKGEAQKNAARALELDPHNEELKSWLESLNSGI
jgi:tetratricopeptide (TPR) repeat protein